MKTPTELHPALTEERLCIIGQTIRAVRHGAVLEHKPEKGDNGWSLGCCCYARTCFAITEAAKKYPEWLTIIEDGKGRHFVFCIGGVPIRFYRGDPEDIPPKVIARGPIEELAMQIAFPGIERTKKARQADTHIRIAVSTDEKGEATDITLLVVDDDLNPVGDGWVIPKEPLKVKRFLKREEGKSLGQLPIGSQKPQQEHGEE